MAGGFQRLIKGQTKIDFVGRSKIWAIISAIVITGSVVALITPGLTLGLEFSGGTALSVPVEGDDVTIPEVEEALAELDLVDPVIQLFDTGSQQQIELRAQRVDPAILEDVRSALAEVAGQLEEDGRPAIGQVNVTDVGPSWGRQVSRKAVRALVVFLVLVTLYISFRFEPKMAAGALAALTHDLVSTAGIYALTGLTVSPATVIAILTLMGFSLYDTVVVFDRVRENAETLGGRETYGSMVNRSMNEVLVRSINTSISSILPVAGLLFVGVFLLNADTLKDLAVAMFIGTAVSTYSSIFVAAPVLAGLKDREPKYRAIKERLAKDRARAGAIAPVAAPASTGSAAASSEAAPAPKAPLSGKPPTAGRPIRPRRKGGRRR